MTDTQDELDAAGLCPFCGTKPEFRYRTPGGRDGAYELQERCFGCVNKYCAVQPHTRWENEGHFVAAKHGNVRNDPDGAAHLAAWNRRAAPASPVGWNEAVAECKAVIRDLSKGETVSGYEQGWNLALGKAHLALGALTKPESAA